MKSLYQVLAVLQVACLTACASGTNAIVETVQNLTSRSGAGLPSQLNPNYQYLRVTTKGGVALLALGDIDHDRHGPVEVWYSAEHEVLRIQDGRVVGAAGMTTEWRNVLLPDLPSWSILAAGDGRLQWTRVRDVMPGYRYGVEDRLRLGRIEAPSRSALLGMDPAQLTWFEEEGDARNLSAMLSPAEAPLPGARYGVELRDGRARVVYAEQCLARDFCITWQRWTAAMSTNK